MIFHHLSKKFKSLLLAASMLTLASCGGGGFTSSDEETADSGSSGSEKTAPLLLALTDAEGDFLTYLVDVTSISLSRSNGSEVEVLPATTSVDFAQYVAVSELLTMADVPSGRYSSVSIALDFSDAQITVQSESGDPLPASVVDSTGEALGSLSVDIQLEGRDGFVLRPGVPSQVTLDFDLDASNEVSIVDGAATVTVSPVLIADTVLSEEKDMRLRGVLAEVSLENSSFDLSLKPFHSRRKNKPGFGELSVMVDEETTYEVNGEAVDSSAGLAALSALDEDAAIVASGTWNTDSKQYLATQVLAGSSVPWDDADILKGTVVSRVGNELTVRGAVFELADGEYAFNDEVTVSLSEETQIRAAQDKRHRHHRGGVDLSLVDISVGSSVVVNGDYLDESTLDASEGHVRIHKTLLSGNVVSVSPLALELNLINGRQIDIFDFNGTGTSEESDADPLSYEIASSGFQNDLALNDPVRVSGFVSAFGSAPEDFGATTVINNTSVRSHMKLSWGGDGSSMAIADISDAGILFDASEEDVKHTMHQAGMRTDLQSLESMPLVVAGDGEGLFTISQEGETQVYNDFSEYVTAVNEIMANGALIAKFYADGYYNGVENTFSSLKMRLKLVSANEDLE